MKEKIQEIMRLMGQTRTQEAIDYLLEISGNDNEILNSLRIQLNITLKRRNLGQIDSQSFNVEISKIHFHLIDIINSLSSEDLKNTETLKVDSNYIEFSKKLNFTRKEHSPSQFSNCLGNKKFITIF